MRVPLSYVPFGRDLISLCSNSVWHDETEWNSVLVAMFSLRRWSHFELLFCCPMADMAQKDSLLKLMLWKLAQYTMSRFFTTSFVWKTFGEKRIERLQQDEQTQLQEGDVVNLDDTSCAHPYAKQLPFLSWLLDHSTKTYSWAMNLVVIQAVLKSGLEYPLFYSIWHKPETKGEGLTKLDLAKQMFLMLRESVKCRLWVAMDRWYLCKDFFAFLESNQFDWVTKAKRNTALFRKEIEPLTRRERYVPLTPIMLIREVFKRLTRQTAAGLVSIAIPDIYMKQPHIVTNRKGKQVTKQRYVLIAAVVAMRLKEDESSSNIDRQKTMNPQLPTKGLISSLVTAMTPQRKPYRRT
jgi:hypothetical protein